MNENPTNKEVTEKAALLADWMMSKIDSHELAEILSYEGEELVSPSHILTLSSAFLILASRAFDTLPYNVSQEIREETFMDLCVEIRKVFRDK